MRRALATAALLGIAACSGSDDAAGPGEVTKGEASAIGDAAQMLDERRPPSASPLEEAGSAAEPGPTSPRT